MTRCSVVVFLEPCFKALLLSCENIVIGGLLKWRFLSHWTGCRIRSHRSCFELCMKGEGCRGQGDSVEVKLIFDTGGEKVTAVSSTKKEVAADVKEYMENGNKYRGDELNAKSKSQSTKLASSELSYSTDDKIASLENKSSKTSVEPFANSLKENEGLQKFFIDELVTSNRLRVENDLAWWFKKEKWVGIWAECCIIWPLL